MRYLPILVLLCLLGSASLGPGAARASSPWQRAGEVLSRDPLPSGELTRIAAFTSAFTTREVPSGIASVDDRGGSIFVAPCDSLEVFLDQTTEGSGLYTWDLRNGVYTVYPKSGIPSLLRTPVAAFEVDTNVGIDALVARVLGTPEVAKACERLTLRRGMDVIAGPVPFTRRKDNEERKSVEVVRNVTVFELLNEIVREAGRGTWLYREFDGESGREYTITVYP